MNANQEQEVVTESVDRDKWRNITSTTRRILCAVPENEGTLLVVDFKTRTYEALASNVIVTNFRSSRKRKNPRE